MELVSLAISFVAGSVVTVVVPKVYSWVKSKVTVVEADVKAVEADVKSVEAKANTVINKL